MDQGRFRAPTNGLGDPSCFNAEPVRASSWRRRVRGGRIGAPRGHGTLDSAADNSSDFRAVTPTSWPDTGSGQRPAPAAPVKRVPRSTRGRTAAARSEPRLASSRTAATRGRQRLTNRKTSLDCCLDQQSSRKRLESRDSQRTLTKFRCRLQSKSDASCHSAAPDPHRVRSKQEGRHV